MGMTIDEALETIKGDRWIGCQEKYAEAMNLIADTMHKYQRITEILYDWNDEKINDIICCIDINGVVENGNVD